ncbi:MAG: GNAT family N-acetyltransferase [Thalassotalea sp.]|nr:GNAT family N-acetyltransferase [Thalassotalea sp.]
MVAFVGDPDWLKQQLNDCLPESQSCGHLLFSEQENSDEITVNGKNYRQYLGTEQKLIIFQAFDDFNVDAFAALSGTIVAGGLLILAIEQSLLNNSSLAHYFIDKAQADPNVHVFKQTDNKTVYPQLTNSSIEQTDVSRSSFAYSCKTAEQQSAVKKILHVVTGHRNRPLVLTADRGRGKSTALALAAVELLKQDNKQLIITAPHSDNLAIFFKQLELSLPQANFTKQSVALGSSTVKFIPLDVLVKENPACHLLMVDEAAGVPLPILRTLLSKYHRQVFVSTIHGYEGAGRGFSTKFIKEMQQSKPQSQHLHIKAPIRWADGDHLERFIFDSLLLAATLPKASLSTAIEYVDITGKELVNDPALLTTIFALLVTAHYQTKPSDLKMLLDNQQVRLVLQMQGKQLLGVALLLAEGGIEQQLSADIKQSLRRIKGHFSPQSLLVHCGAEQAFKYKYQRVVRIAIHPEVQQLGLGHKLIKQCKLIACEQGSDFITSSFGANAQLLNFWLANDFKLTRIGFSKDKASGEHSALVIHSLNNKNELFANSLAENFSLDFHYLMSDEYKYLATDLMLLLLQQLPDPYLTLNHQQAHVDQETVLDFANGYRVFSSCAPALRRKFITWVNTDKVSLTDTLSDTDVGLMVMLRKVIQQQSWSDIYQEFNLTGKKQTLQLMKEFALHSWS